MYKYLLIFSFFFFVLECYSQSCLSSGITFTNQAQIDAFPANYPGCTMIIGNLVFDDNLQGNIVNLDSMIQIESVGGDLRFEQIANLSNLQGLNNLELISGDLYFHQNSALNNLQGLESLTSIGEDLHFLNNPSFSSLDGIQNITSIGERIIISSTSPQNLNQLSNLTEINNWLFLNNSNVNSLSGLENITEINELRINNCDNLTSFTSLSSLAFSEYISIENCDNIQNFTGLSALTTLGRGLWIDNNDALLSLDGLEGLTDVGINANNFGVIGIKGNDFLTNLDGLVNVLNVDGLIRIDNNQALGDISGLNNIDPNSIIGANGVTDLEIYENDLLAVCNIEMICTFLDIPGKTASFYNNASGCNSELEVADACTVVCPTGNQVFLTQADVDLFVNNWSSCDSLDGDLIIGDDFFPYSASDITDLTSLTSLTSIGDRLRIYNNPNLISLDGLENIDNVDDIFIRFNDNLVTIDEFTNVTSINGTLWIESPVTDISGFSNLQNVNELIIQNTDLVDLGDLSSISSIEKISISSNDLLTDVGDLDGLSPSLINFNNLPLVTTLPSLTMPTSSDRITLNSMPNVTTTSSISGPISLSSSFAGVSINNMLNLTDLSILSQLESTQGDVNIGQFGSNFSGLQDLSDLSNLQSVSGDLHLQNLPNISDLNDLSNLTLVEQNLLIINLDNLTSLNGLENIDGVALDLANIRLNNLLSSCEVASLCDHIDNGGNTIINSNASGCNSTSEVETACAALPVTYSKGLRAQVQGKSVNLSFSIAQQINNSHFEIEHSIDGRNFENIGQILGSGNTITEKSYQYTHNTPNSGTNYYRIKQVDYDGNYSFSNIASASIRNRDKVNLYPNPMSDQLNVIADEKLSFVIRNINGLTIFEGNTEEDRTINLLFFKKGIYTIQFSNGYIERLVKI